MAFRFNFLRGRCGMWRLDLVLLSLLGTYLPRQTGQSLRLPGTRCGQNPLRTEPQAASRRWKRFGWPCGSAGVRERTDIWRPCGLAAPEKPETSMRQEDDVRGAFGSAVGGRIVGGGAQPAASARSRDGKRGGCVCFLSRLVAEPFRCSGGRIPWRSPLSFG